MNFEGFLRKLFKNYQFADQHLLVYQDFKRSGELFRYSCLGETPLSFVITKGDQYQICDDISADLSISEVQGFIEVQDLLNFANRMAILEKALASIPTVQIYSSKYTNIILNALSSSNQVLELHYDCLGKESVELLKFHLHHVQKLILRWFRPPSSDFYDQLLYTPLTCLELNDMYLSEEHQTHIRNLLKLKLVDVALVNVQLDDRWHDLDLSTKKPPVQKLQLGNVNIPIPIVHQLIGHSTLSVLKLHAISFSNHDIPVIENLKELEWTSINLLDFNQDYFVQLLQKNQELTFLSFTYNMFTKQNTLDLKIALQNHLHLETLDIEYDAGFDFEIISENTSIKNLSLITQQFTFPHSMYGNHFITEMKVNGVYDTTITDRNRQEFKQNLVHLFLARRSLLLLAFPHELNIYILRKMCYASYIPRLYIDTLAEKLLTGRFDITQPFDLKILL
ncbi:hypothetical protein HDV06_001773 [Boothiomyces sp. JEL0866]|nr:hypothetical protein HDV06_001773 [Boothiomyces sp. JEL0866]